MPSLAWAVVRGQEVSAGGAGGAGPRTVFQIGSATKVFTALLLADMAERGEVHLADPAAAYLPGARAAPAPSAPLLPAIRATLIPRQPVPGGEISLAWHHLRRGDHTIISHNGMTGGFSSMVAFDPVRGLGVAALANTASRPPSPLDEAVLRALS